MTEPLYRCHVCRLDWLEGQLSNDPPWDPEDRCPVCGGAVKRADYGDLPMFGGLVVDTPPGDVIR